MSLLVEEPVQDQAMQPESDDDTFWHEQFYRPLNLRKQIKKTGMGLNLFARFTGVSLNTLKRIVRHESARRRSAEQIAYWYWRLVKDCPDQETAFNLLFELKPRIRQRKRRARPHV